MRLRVNGIEAFAATGGRDFDPSLPLALFLHGAGLDHSAWALHGRWFAYHGWSVLAPDLPGHGRSAGEPLSSIAAMADWTAALIEAAGAKSARIIGHSMGALIALELAARHRDKVASLALLGAAASMPVSPALLSAAKVNDHAAVDMVAIWGHGYRACLGGSQAPGLWMLGNAERVLERARPGVLFTDLSACNDYQDGLTAAASISVPVTLVLGERDVMTPLKAGKALAAALSAPRVVCVSGAGHMLMAEHPDAVLDALTDI